MSRLSIAGLVLVAVVVLVGVRFYYWGRTVRSHYQVSAAQPATAGADTQWTLTRSASSGGASGDSSGNQKWTARDTAGDGTWNEISTPEGSFMRPTESSPRRWLIVCLDGIPLPLMQALWDNGQFREFFRPTAAISTFPSDTELALTTALHAAPVEGYENLYFDRAANSMRGGPWATLSGSGAPYIGKLDYDPPGWAKGLSYLAVRRTYNADIGRFRAAFLRTNQPIFIAHISASDALMHVRTAQQAYPLLLEFDDALRDIYLDARGQLGIIVFSDHGNTQTLSHPVAIEKFLSDRGWRVSSSLRGTHDIVIPSYGLLGFAAIYCRPEAVEQIAEQLRGVKGADMIVSRNGSGVNSATIRAVSEPAIAKLEWSDDGQRYRYTASVGDPLVLVDIFNRLRTAGKLDAQGFADEDDLFAATSSAVFPDSAARIRLWATGVRNPSDIIVNLRPGYFHGSGGFQKLVTLVSSHGGIDQSSSRGFEMATFPLPPTTRIGDVIPARLLELASASR